MQIAGTLPIGLCGKPADFSDVLAWQLEAKQFFRELLISGVESFGSSGLTARAFEPSLDMEGEFEELVPKLPGTVGPQESSERP